MTTTGSEPSADLRKVAQVMALLWVAQPWRTVYAAMRALDMRRDNGRPFLQDEVKQALPALKAIGWLPEKEERSGYHMLHDSVRGRLHRELLEAHSLDALRHALYTAHGGPEVWRYRYQSGDAYPIALWRLEVFGGTSSHELSTVHRRLSQIAHMPGVEVAALFPGFDAKAFERVAEELRWRLLFTAARALAEEWRADLVPMCDWGLDRLRTQAQQVPGSVRLALAQLCILRGESDAAQAGLAGLDSGTADALRASLLVLAGRWREAQAAFEAAIKRLQVETKARKHVLPRAIAWLYPVALLAQQTPAGMTLARKFALQESGRRDPPPSHPWGRWAHAIGVRLGETVLERSAFELRLDRYRPIEPETITQILLAAWLGPEAMRVDADGVAGRNERHQFLDVIRQRLHACGFAWLLAQVDAAAAVLDRREPSGVFFVAGGQEEWRVVLAALQSLEVGRKKTDAQGDGSRMLWAVQVSRDGAVNAIEPLEQKRGARGWGAPKPVALSRLAGKTALAAHDAKVARAIRQVSTHPKRWLLDRAAAIIALVGHPGVVLAEAPDRLVDVIEGTPELEIVREGEHYRMIVTPALRVASDADDADDPDEDDDDWAYISGARPPDTVALRSITVVRDSPQRLRVIQLNPAQRRAAQLVSGRFAVPTSAEEELKAAVRALAGHFQVHADQADASHDVAPESRLRAELAPAGDDLVLRLVVAPLGADGPRVVPGSGRPRLLASVRGVTLGVRRDFVAERTHREAVLDALPFLDEHAVAATECEWRVSDPEHALAMIEALPGLPAVCAVDWPKGKPVRVVTVDTPQMGVRVASERDWFRIEGRVAVDERLALDFEALLAAGRGRSRFVPMGEGVYVALTRRLKQQLADLAAISEADAGGAKVPRMAAAWLDESLEGAKVESDSDFRNAIERLHAAQAEAPELPKSLQADLRPYQEDGYRWAMRLASAGLGGCLADDMGLGKTLQGLGVLLARGHLGPALVIAPTSVCGNWIAEAGRFAPSLNVVSYGDAERESVVSDAGPMDVIVVSYTLLQLASDRFASRHWSTVIADEAQAIKNAAAKRSIAVFDLDTGFRLALSGTPVENRLAELWSIMRFVNPGLLGTQGRFSERFAGPIERARDRDAQHLLRRLIGPFVLRRTKSQVLQELPARTELLISVMPEATEAAHYEALRRQAMAESDVLLATAPAGQAAFNILAHLTRLRRAACDPRLVNPQFGIAGAKVQAFADLATELVANGHKALVFSQFVDFLQLLRLPLDAGGIAYQYLDGSTPAAERTRRVAAFQAGQGDLFLISLKAGGFGLNLTAADYVLITDPWWNPAAEDQAMGRAHRIGQVRPVTVYRLVTRGTVEERIVALHQDKRALAESVIAEGEVAALPSAADLVALMRG